jgi:hypothetical protein
MDQGMQDINKGQVVDTVYAQDPGNYGAANTKYGGMIKAQEGLTMPSDNTRTAPVYVPQKLQEGKIQEMIDDTKKYQEQLNLMKTPYTAVAMPNPNEAWPGDSIRFFPGQVTNYGVPYTTDIFYGLSEMGYTPEDFVDMVNNKGGRMYQDTVAVRANDHIMTNQKYGGGQPQYEDGGVYDLTPDEIERVLAMGGSIEYM